MLDSLIAKLRVRSDTKSDAIGVVGAMQQARSRKKRKPHEWCECGHWGSNHAGKCWCGCPAYKPRQVDPVDREAPISRAASG